MLLRVKAAGHEPDRLEGRSTGVLRRRAARRAAWARGRRRGGGRAGRRRRPTGSRRATGCSATRARPAYAEYALSRPQMLQQKPPGLAWEVAGSLGVVVGTAYATLEALKLGTGETLIVLGASGRRLDRHPARGGSRTAGRRDRGTCEAGGAERARCDSGRLRGRPARAAREAGGGRRRRARHLRTRRDRPAVELKGNVDRVLTIAYSEQANDLGVPFHAGGGGELTGTALEETIPLIEAGRDQLPDRRACSTWATSPTPCARASTAMRPASSWSFPRPRDGRPQGASSAMRQRAVRAARVDDDRVAAVLVGDRRRPSPLSVSVPVASGVSPASYMLASSISSCVPLTTSASSASAIAVAALLRASRRPRRSRRPRSTSRRAASRSRRVDRCGERSDSSCGVSAAIGGQDIDRGAWREPAGVGAADSVERMATTDAQREHACSGWPRSASR